MRDQTANLSDWSARRRPGLDGVFLEEPLRAALRGGCPHALAALYRQYARPLSLYLRSLAYRLGAADLGQRSVLADLVQEVFLRAFAPAARARYSPVAGVRAYLNTIGRHCLFDLLRWRRRELLVDDARDLLGSPSSVSSPVCAVQPALASDAIATVPRNIERTRLEWPFKDSFMSAPGGDSACQRGTPCPVPDVPTDSARSWSIFLVAAPVARPETPIAVAAPGGVCKTLARGGLARLVS
jgi:DNA-directed RNA polymerase specialized sigma24 family protein